VWKWTGWVGRLGVVDRSHYKGIKVDKGLRRGGGKGGFFRDLPGEGDLLDVLQRVLQAEIGLQRA